jgi:methyl-accepting chemotaxis protein
MNKLTGSIRTKLLLAFFVLGIVPVAVVGGFAVAKANRALLDRSGVAQQAKAAASMETIDRVLYERYGDVQAFAFHPAALGETDEVAAATDFYTKSYGYYDLMVVADASGKIVAANRVSGTGTSVDTSFLLGKDASGEAWFGPARAMGREQTWVGDALKHPWVAQVTRGSGLSLAFAAPVFDAQGKVARVWCNFASYDRTAGDVLAALRERMKDLGSDSVETVLVNKKGVVIDGSDPSLTFGTDLVARGSGPAAALVEGKAGFHDRQHERTGEHLGIGWAPEKGFHEYKGFGWGLVIREPASDAATLRNLVIGGVLLTGLVIAAVGLWIARRFAKPLRRSVEVLGAVAKGDLNVRMEVEGNDELARMSVAINDALAQISAAFGSINGRVQQLEKAADNLGKVRASLASSSEGNANQAASAAAAAEQVGKNIETVAAGTEEMGASINEISRNATDAAKVALGAVKTAETANQTVTHLGLSSQEIGKVVKLIASIAEQTNLLALNATIEAARAGDAGKGFAVVAAEVKDLARATANATEEISQKVETIQSDSRAAVEAITEISQVVDRINAIQSSIATAVEEQSATTNEITRNIAEVSTAAAEIAKSISHVAESARSTTADAGHVEDTSNAMTRVAIDLRHELDKFEHGGEEQKPGYEPVGAAPGLVPGRGAPGGQL